MNTTRNLEDTIRQAEQNVAFVRATILSLHDPTLAQVTVLRDLLWDAGSEHLETVALFQPEAFAEQEENFDNFEGLYREVNLIMVEKHAAAKRYQARESGKAAQTAAEAWLTQQLKAWQSIQVDSSEQDLESQKANSQTFESQVLVARVCDLPSDSNPPSTSVSRSREKPAKNLSVDTQSQAPDVANRRPQNSTVTVDPVNHPVPNSEEVSLVK